MIAAVYSREIQGEDGDGQFDCSLCARSPAVWEERGRCTGTLAEPVGLHMDSTRYGWAEYPAEFDVCPRGLLRPDLRPAETLVARIVSHAASAEVDKRWPEIPARLAGLVRLWRFAENDRTRSEMEALRRRSEK